MPNFKTGQKNSCKDLIRELAKIIQTPYGFYIFLWEYFLIFLKNLQLFVEKNQL